MTKLIKKHQKGKTVSELYEQKTGKKWYTAKQEGLTSGSYEDNMKLKRRLLSGEFDLNKAKSIEDTKELLSIESTRTEMPVDEGLNKYLKPSNNYSNTQSFKDAFSKARKELGDNKIFEYNGKLYTTNISKNRKEIFKSIMDLQMASNSQKLFESEPKVTFGFEHKTKDKSTDKTKDKSTDKTKEEYKTFYSNGNQYNVPKSKIKFKAVDEWDDTGSLLVENKLNSSDEQVKFNNWWNKNGEKHKNKNRGEIYNQYKISQGYTIAIPYEGDEGYEDYKGYVYFSPEEFEKFKVNTVKN